MLNNPDELHHIYKDAEWVTVKNQTGTWIRITEIGGFSLVAKWVRNDILEDGYIGFLGQHVCTLELDLKTENALTSNGLHTLGKLCSVHSADLKKLPNIGKITYKKIVDALNKQGLKLKS